MASLLHVAPLLLVGCGATAPGAEEPIGAQRWASFTAEISRARVGCADGAREAFRDEARYPDIAGCAGGWDRPGVTMVSPPHCDRVAGDDGGSPDGEGCGVSDLCAAGWHVCLGPSEVSTHSIDGCAGAHDAALSFFVTRTSGPGCGICATSSASGTALGCTGNDCRLDCAPNAATQNDLFGCGTIGSRPEASSCGVLDASSGNLCDALPAPWACLDDGSGTHEAERVTKRGAPAGGALCCRD